MRKEAAEAKAVLNVWRLQILSRNLQEMILAKWQRKRLRTREALEEDAWEAQRRLERCARVMGAILVWSAKNARDGETIRAYFRWLAKAAELRRQMVENIARLKELAELPEDVWKAWKSLASQDQTARMIMLKKRLGKWSGA